MSARPLIVMADGPDGPLPDPKLVGELAAIGEADVLLGWVLQAPPWLEPAPSASPRRPPAGAAVPLQAPTGPTVSTFLTGPGTRTAVAAGTVSATALRLSALPGLLAGRLRPRVAVVGACRDGRTWRLHASPGWALPAMRNAEAVVIERWPGAPLRGAAEVEGRVAGVVDRSDPPDPPPLNSPRPEHARIGELVAALVPAGATVQWGPGVIGASVVGALDKPVGVRSGLVTDELVALAGRGLLRGVAQAAYMWGGSQLAAMVESGALELRSVEHIHDVSAIASVGRFVAINTALEVGLDGAANVETVQGRRVSGPGGHPDFAAGACGSPGGLSIVALAASRSGRSTIVARPWVVSTPRSDVDVVVTEHGVADLRGCDDSERSLRIIALAAPEHREALYKSLH